MSEVRTRLEELLDEPPAGVRGEAQSLLEAAASEDDAAYRLLRLGLRVPENDEVWLDEIARLPLHHVRDIAAADPDLASDSALVMLGHLGSEAWGYRDFDYLNTPLRWIHEVLRGLTAEAQYGLAEDLATKAFERERHWDRFRQKRVTADWLSSLDEIEGQAIRRPFEGAV